MQTLKTEVILNAPIDTVFSFFSNIENLEKITPNWLNFSLLAQPPMTIKKGSLFHFQIRLFKIPLKWKTEITCWEPPFRFSDEQIKGPYKKWIHEHRFIEEGNQTRMIDTVHYKVPGWFLSPLILKLFVKSAVIEIFRYRTEKIKQIFSDNQI